MFELKTNTIFGPGSSKNIGEIISADGRKAVALFVDSAIIKTSAIAEVIEHIKKGCDLVKVFENAVAEPDYDYLESVRSGFSGLSVDYIIAIGGGSTMDLAKGIAVLLNNPGKALEYRGFDKVKKSAVPIVAVPTTAGTGSEVTPNASFIDNKEGRKLGINTEYITPKYAILDPVLIVSCPRGVTVSSGMDVLVHCIESFVSKQATPLSREFSRIAFQLAFNSLEKNVSAPNDLDARGKTLLASHYAGISIMLAGGGPSAGMSYPLGVFHKVPHGMAGAVFLPKVIESNVSRGFLGYSELHDLIDGVEKDISVKEKNLRFSKEMYRLCESLGVPKKLNGFGVNETNVKLIINDIMTNMKGSLQQNPIEFGEKEVEKILYSMI